MNPKRHDTPCGSFDRSPADDPSARSPCPGPRPALPPLTPHTDWPLIIGLVAALVLGPAAGTQYVAWRLGFDPHLGPPLVLLSEATARSLRVIGVVALGGALVGALIAPPRFPSALREAALPLAVLATSLALASVGRIYAPHRIVTWYIARAALPLPGGAAFPMAWGLVLMISVVTALSITAAWPAGVRTRPSHSHGSAYWGDGAALDRPRGLLLGRHGARLLRSGAEGHVLTVAPTRAGKGVSAVIPNLLDYSGGVLVTDPKGENYAVTHQWRYTLGHPVYAFDPFGIASKAEDDDSTDPKYVANASFNPLDLITTANDDAVDDARLLADMLVLPAAREGEQAFWNEEARALLTGLILYAASSDQPEIKTLARVRLLLTQPPDACATLLRDMLGNSAFNGLVARAAARLLQKADRERSGVISTAQSHTHFLDSPRMTKVLSFTSANLDLGALKHGAATVYLILPTDRLATYARWLRVMIACALLATARVRGQPKERVLFLLDEFPHLGRLYPVQRDIGLAAGFGVTFWLVVQDLSQLQSTYPDAWPTFVANADVLQAFGVNDWETADYLSKLTGEATIHVESEHHSRGVSHGRHAHRQIGAARTRGEQGRRLLLPDEVRRLPDELELLFVKGSAPLLVERVNYLRDPEFSGRARPNPLYQPVATATDE